MALLYGVVIFTMPSCTIKGTLWLCNPADVIRVTISPAQKVWITNWARQGGDNEKKLLGCIVRSQPLCSIILNCWAFQVSLKEGASIECVHEVACASVCAISVHHSDDSHQLLHLLPVRFSLFAVYPAARLLASPADILKEEIWKQEGVADEKLKWN